MERSINWYLYKGNTMKKLSLKLIKYDSFRKEIVFSVETQTHICRLFGDPATVAINDFIAKNGVKLRSLFFPEYYKDLKLLYVRGEKTERNGNLVYIPTCDFDMVMEAIGEYNKYFEDFEEEKIITPTPCENKVIEIDGKKYKLVYVKG